MAFWLRHGFTCARKMRTFKSVLPLQFLRQISCAQSNDLKGLVLGIYEGNQDHATKLTEAGQNLDHKLNGRITELIKESKLDGRIGKGKIFNNIYDEFQSIAVIGLGPEGVGYNVLEAMNEGMENVRIAAAIGAQKLHSQNIDNIFIDSMEYAEQAAEGAALGVYKYQDNRSDEDRLPSAKLELFDTEDLDGWTRGLFKAEAQNLARRMCEAPANQMTPAIFAKTASDMLSPCGVNVQIHNIDWIEIERLESFLAVSTGSCVPPILLEMSYNGAVNNAEQSIVLVGNGLTFNSGGICLKDKNGLDEYRASIAGAAAVVATMRAAAALSLPIKLQAVVPLCENMPSGMASRPGDIITCLNGKTLAIQDTSNAEVLMLADTLTYALNTYKPKLVVDVATLSCKAFGGAATGVFTNSHHIYEQFEKAGAITGDRVWRLPLWNYFKRQVTQHAGYDVGTPIEGTDSAALSAAVLQEFVPCGDWAHLDIRGVGMKSADTIVPYLPEGRMTGRPTRTLIQFLCQMACPEEQVKDLKN